MFDKRTKKDTDYFLILCWCEYNQTNVNKWLNIFQLRSTTNRNKFQN